MSNYDIRIHRNMMVPDRDGDRDRTDNLLILMIRQT